MKKLFYILSIFSVLFIVSSCSNEAKTSFEAIKLHYTEISSQNKTPELLEQLLSEIDSHLNTYPSFEGNEELIGMKDNITKMIDNTIFSALKNVYESLQTKSFEDYDVAVQSYNELKSKLNEYVTSTGDNENNQKASEIISEIEKRLSGIESEKVDFENAVGSNSIETIESFLSDYPNSVMRAMLTDKIDQIIVTDLMVNFNSSPSSITDLNTSISSAKDCLNKLNSIDAKSKVSEMISNLESQRQQVLDSELNSAVPRLIEEMEDKARSVAGSKHSTYDVEMCVARGSNPEITRNSGNLERIYEVNLIGSFLGRDKRVMEIRITGRYNGDLKTGVRTYITGNNIVSDSKL